MHLCEHLIYMQQTQRARLSSLCSAQSQLDTYARLMEDLTVTGDEDVRDRGVLPPQVFHNPLTLASSVLF